MHHRLFSRDYLIIAFLGFCAFILWIIFEADTGADNIFINLVRLIPCGDKLGHVLLYGGLALLLNLLLMRRTIALRSLRFQWGSVLVLIFAVLEELSQGLFATRSLDGWDVLADLLGVYVAAVLVRWKKGTG
jgi:polysaccharide biosynthesis protein VpsQ